jgi:hypothetical protein
VLEKLFAELAAVITASGGPLTGVSLGTVITTWLAAPTFPAVWATAASTPIGSVSAALPSTIAGLFAAPVPKPQGLSSQLNPGIGCPGFFAG